MPKIIVLVGHCGADSSSLRIVVQGSDRDVRVIMADDIRELTQALAAGVDLVLVNRELGWGFNDGSGVDLIRDLHTKHPTMKLMLVSNYADAQQNAIAAGAVPGFGKRELGTPRVKQIIRDALGVNVG